MSVEVAPTGVVPGEGWELAHVVQQRCPAQRHIRRHSLHHVGDMGVQVKFMMGRMLIKAHRSRQLRDHLGDQERVFLQFPGRDPGQQPAELRKDTLPGQMVHQRGQLLHRLQGPRLRRQVIGDGKP